MKKNSYIVNHAESTDIVISKNVLHRIETILLEYHHSAYVILCDTVTEKLFANQIKTRLSSLGVPIAIEVIKKGEESKNFSTLLTVLQKMHTNGLDRKSALLSVGGGVVGDIATVAAGLYFRGIDCIQVPTTLLSQVDAAIGGKGAVDLGTHKNTIGIIKQPRLIIIDPNTISSLPKEEINSGMGEIIKYAIALDKNLFEKIEEKKVTQELLESIITRCVELKIDIIKSDPLDISGKRAMLNFGHTLGHAIELKTHLLHGQAISVGMSFALTLSKKLGFLSEKSEQKALDLLQKYNLPISVSNIDMHEIMVLMKRDKKSISRTIKMVLIRDIGNVFLHTVPEKTIQQVLSKVII